MANNRKINPMTTEPMMARGIIPAPITMPQAIAQNRKTISTGSLMAARKRTMERAPTMPKDMTTLEVTAMTTKVVTRVSPTGLKEKPVEYITPVKFFVNHKNKQPHYQGNRHANQYVNNGKLGNVL